MLPGGIAWIGPIELLPGRALADDTYPQGKESLSIRPDKPRFVSGLLNDEPSGRGAGSPPSAERVPTKNSSHRLRMVIARFMQLRIGRFAARGNGFPKGERHLTRGMQNNCRIFLKCQAWLK
jgi:hypothetical protein